MPKYISLYVFTYWSFWIYSWLSSYVLYATPIVKHTTILYHSNKNYNIPLELKNARPSARWMGILKTFLLAAVPGEVCDSVYLQVLQNCMLKCLFKISPNQHQTTLIWDNIISYPYKKHIWNWHSFCLDCRWGLQCSYLDGFFIQSFHVWQCYA